MNRLFSFLFLIFFLTTACQEQSKLHSFKLWYKQPADQWMEALPIGNGSFGAMVYGRTDTELIKLNYDAFWSGHPRDFSNSYVTGISDQVAQLVAERKYTEANKLVRKLQGPYTQSYEPLADLKLTLNHRNPVNYRRELNLSDATTSVSYDNNGVSYIRELFSSFPDQVIAIRLTASKADSLNFKLSLKSLTHYKIEVEADVYSLVAKADEDILPNYFKRGDQARTYGGWDGEGMKAQVDVRVLAPGADVSVSDEGIALRNGKDALILLSAATSFNGPFKSPAFEGKNYAVLADSLLKQASTQKLGATEGKTRDRLPCLI